MHTRKFVNTSTLVLALSVTDRLLIIWCTYNLVSYKKRIVSQDMTWFYGCYTEILYNLIDSFMIDWIFKVYGEMITIMQQKKRPYYNVLISYSIVYLVHVLKFTFCM